MRKALKRPKAKVWYTAPYYAQAKMICWEMLQAILPPEIVAKKNESELWIELINGSKIFLKGCDNEDSLVGVGLDFIVPDEYALYKPHVWSKILRPMLSDTEGGALFIGTPRGKNAFFDLYLRGQREPNWKSWQFPTSRNPFIPLREIEEARKTLPERYFRQEYEASFEDYIGLIWPEFNQAEHLIEPTYIPDMYVKIGAIDPALSGTTGALKTALDEDGNIIVYEEYYEANKRVSEVSESIKEEKVRWYLPPDAFKKSIEKEGKLYSFEDEYSDNGIKSSQAEANVEAGINRVGEYFKTGKIKIFKTCKNLIYELERYHWAEERETVSGIVKPQPFKKDDHLCDCLRYLVMSRTDKAEFPEPEINPLSPWGRVMNKRKKTDFVYGH